MPTLSIKIGDREVDVEQVETAPVSISYKLEDPENFEQKKSAESLNLVVPASRNNALTAGFLHDPAAIESGNGEHSRPLPCTITAEGTEVFKGKAFLREASCQETEVSYSYDCFGNNADWLIGLKDKTLWDFVSKRNHYLTPQVQEASWYDYKYNNSEANDFLYAPVRRRKLFKKYNGLDNQVVTPFDLTPSVSPYWILVRGLRSMGYRIQSTFLDSPFFRAHVMPWTWGSFLYSEQSKFAPFKFRAMCNQQEVKNGLAGSWNEWVSPASGAPVARVLSWSDVSSGGAMGGFQATPDLYFFSGQQHMEYHYPAGSTLGIITMGFHLFTYYYVYSAGSNAAWGLRVYWFVTPAGQSLSANPDPADAVAVDLIVQKEGGGVDESVVSVNREITMNPGDTVTAIMRIDANAGGYSLNWKIGMPYPSPANTWPASYLENTYIKKAIGSTVNFQDYSGFRKYKFLDFMRGLIDNFNLQINTDPVAKVVYLEPSDEYELPNGSRFQGYFLKDALNQSQNYSLDWSKKQDVSKTSHVKLYAENNREFVFKHKDDGNDGAATVLAKRENVVPGAAKYLFPERFSEGIDERENRFFSPVVHVKMPGWSNISNITPQLVALIPENLSSTSQSEDEQSFEPKLCFYKGIVNDNGGWRWSHDPKGQTVITHTNMPYMFAVNYQPGGETDAVLTYSDQLINGTVVPGLMRRYYLTRLAKMRNGKLYTTWIKLSTTDIINWLHREQIRIGQNGYNLIEIKDFKPLMPDSVECTMWQVAHPSSVDDASVFPSANSIKNAQLANGNDMKYVPMFILETDIPKE